MARVSSARHLMLAQLRLGDLPRRSHGKGRKADQRERSKIIGYGRRNGRLQMFEINVTAVTGDISHRPLPKGRIGQPDHSGLLDARLRAQRFFDVAWKPGLAADL